MSVTGASAAPTGRLSLLVLNPAGEGDWGGVERWLFDVAAGLRGRGHEVSITGRPGSLWIERGAAAGFPACGIGLRGEFRPLQTLKLARFMRRHRVDVVATKLHRGIRVAGFSGLFAGRPPVVAFMGLVETRPGLRYRWTYRLFLDRVVTLTERMRAEIVARGGLDPDRVAVVPQCLRASDYEVPESEAAALRRELGIDDGAPVAAAIGRLHLQKRFDVLFHAFALARRRLPGAVLLLAGHGRLLPDLERLVGRLDLADSVRLLGFRSDVARVLAAADCLVMSSDVEGVPVVGLEAMAASRPVVATAVGSIDAEVEDGRTGVLVPRGDPQALADGLVKVLGSADRGRAMGRAGRAKVVAEFPISRCVEETERLLLSVRRGAGAA